MRKVVVLFFSILCISLFAQELNELTIFGKAVKTNDIVSSSIKDVNNRKASCIIFLTDLEVDMDFKPNIELVKLISKAGRHEVYVQPGERVIEVLASGYKPLNLVLSSYGISKLESGDVYQIEITGNNKILSASGKGSLILNTIPEDSNISIAEFPDFKANTPYEFKNYLARPYHFHLSKYRYEPVDTVIVIENSKNKTQTIALIPEWGNLEITSVPSNAEVFINDEFIGTSPLSLKGVKNGLDQGKYKILLNHPSNLYSSEETEIIINNNSIVEKHFVLNDLSGSIKINVFPKPVNVYINDNFDDELSLGKEKRFRNGEYKIKIEKKGNHQNSYHTIIKNITLSKNDLIEIEDILTEYNGTILLSSNISGTKFTIIDSETESVIMENTIQDSFEVITGRYKVIATNSNKEYFSKTKDISVEKNKKTFVNFQMEKSKSIVIESNPSGAEIYIDNEYLGITPLDIVMKSVSNKIKLEKENYYSSYKKIELKSTKIIYGFNLRQKSSYWSSIILSPNNLSLEFSFLSKNSIYTFGYWNFKDNRNIPDYVDHTNVDDYPDIDPVSHKVGTYSKWSWGGYYKQGFINEYPLPFSFNIGLGWLFKTVYPIFEADENASLGSGIQNGEYWTSTESNMYYEGRCDYDHYFPIVLGVSFPVSSFVIHLDYLTTFGKINTLQYGVGLTF